MNAAVPRYRAVSAEKAGGATYTPSLLARFVARRIVENADLDGRVELSILDPAIGDGALVAAGSVITEPVPADALGLGRARQVNIEGWAADYRRRLHEDDEV